MYTVGTVSLTNGSKTVTGSGTAWLANAAVGNSFALQGGTVGYQIEAVPGDGSLTLVEPYGGSSASGQLYTITTGITSDGLALPYAEKGDNDPEVLGKLQASKVGGALASELSLSVAGAVDVTLTNLQARAGSYKFTGALTGNINVIFPAKARLMWVYNNTSGAFTLTVVSSGSGSPLSGGLAIAQGKSALVWCDGTSMRSALTDSVAMGLGTMSLQNANAVAITGGSLSGMTSYAGGTASFTTGDFSGLLQGIKSTASQIRAYGWDAVSGAGTDRGSIELGSAASYYGRIGYANTGALYLDNIYDNAAAATYVRMRVGGTPVNALTILGTGTVQFPSTIGVGAASPSTSGSGVTFPATQAASSNANTLDDYEEGTWTATITCGVSGTVTLTSGAGGDLCFYTKIGRMVEINGYLSVASVSSPVGAFNVNGLPFTVFNNDGNYAAVAVRADGLTAGATTSLQGYAARANTTMAFEKFAAGAASVLAGNVQAASNFMFNCSYNAAT